jgi:hypothetical protein
VNKQGLAKFLENATPQRPDVGPPLPYVFNLMWPRAMVNNMPKVMQNVGLHYSNARATLIRPLWR